MAVPAAPVLEARNTGDNSVRLVWPEVSGATGYNLYRGTSELAPETQGRNEKQTVTIDATGGTFKLTYSGQQTTAINWNATAQAVEDALVALSNIELGDVDVTLVGLVYTVEFTGLLARTNVAQMTSDATLLTGGPHTATVATSVAGVAARTLSVVSPLYDATTTNVNYWYTVRAKNAEGEGAASNIVRVLAAVSSDPDTDPTRALKTVRTFIGQYGGVNAP
jgi:hypothetical protein